MIWRFESHYATRRWFEQSSLPLAVDIRSASAVAVIFSRRFLRQLNDGD